ncbi:MAG TPA: hypothetical protein VEF06_02375 [Bryobacteraceae bacterium]|nr:hypothetical protein [Bryobacteraceae bacterium]
MTRRELFLIAAQAAVQAKAQSNPDRAAALIREFESQGDHRTGTAVDNASGDWLFDQVKRIGLDPIREPWSINRVDPLGSGITIGTRYLEGLPLFDCAWTDPKGITGRLGALGSDAPIGVGEAAPNNADSGPIGEARRSSKHKAIVLVTKGQRPGLCPNNADDFLRPFGPPVLQVSSDYQQFLKDGAEATLVAPTSRTQTTAFNVTAKISGASPALPALIVMTPRSGWWTCASERGGGIVCWLELMRNLRDSRPARDILFVASSGHEVGYLGIEAFVARRPGIVKQAHAWIHFGANVGAAQSPGNTVQASDDDMEKLEAGSMTEAGLTVDRRVPRGRVPGGEAGVVHKGGGRYLSIIGASALFHNQLDRGPEAIDPKAIATFATVFTSIAKQLAGNS